MGWYTVTDMRYGLALGISVGILVLGGIGLLILNGKPHDPLQDAITGEYATSTMTTFSLSSNAFEANGRIPEKYTCDGDSVNPPLTISSVPEGTKSLVLLVTDPDIPDSVKQSRHIEKFDHWVVFNIAASTTEIGENTMPSGIQGVNGAGKSAYAGPCPPDREHRYFFNLYALDRMLGLTDSATLDQVKAAIDQGPVLGMAELVGRYDRTR